MAKDPRGVLRGKCTACACVQYILPPEPGAAKCSQCSHAPAKHVNMAASHSQPALSYAGAVNHQTPYQHHIHSSPASAAAASSSAYGGHSGVSGYSPHAYGGYHSQVPPSLHLPQCSAEGCYNKVHYDRELGPFDYCSPECRDRHLLPKERQELDRDIKTFSMKIADLSPLDPVQGTKLRCEVEKRPNQELGIVIGKCSVKEGLLVTGVRIGSLAYESVKEGNLKFLDVITELNGIPYTLESEFQESVLPKSLVQLTLKRPYTVPSVKKLLSEVKLKYSSATHILVLQNPKQFGGGYGFGCVPYFVKEEGVMLALSDTPQSSAYRSGATSDDVIMMYATMDNSKIGDLKLPLSKKQAEGKENQEVKDFKSDIDKAARNGSSLIFVVKRLRPIM